MERDDLYFKPIFQGRATSGSVKARRESYDCFAGRGQYLFTYHME